MEVESGAGSFVEFGVCELRGIVLIENGVAWRGVAWIGLFF